MFKSFLDSHGWRLGVWFITPIKGAARVVAAGAREAAARPETVVWQCFQDNTVQVKITGTGVVNPE
jgi:hypothetical protein